MTQNPQNSKEARANISLTGSNARLLRELHTSLSVKHTPVTVTYTDVVGIALSLLKAELENN